MKDAAIVILAALAGFALWWSHISIARILRDRIYGPTN